MAITFSAASMYSAGMAFASSSNRPESSGTLFVKSRSTLAGSSTSPRFLPKAIPQPMAMTSSPRSLTAMTILLFRTFAIFNGVSSACCKAAFLRFIAFLRKKGQKNTANPKIAKPVPKFTHVPYFWYCLLPVTIRIKTADSIVRSYAYKISQLLKKSTSFRRFHSFAHSQRIFFVQLSKKSVTT